MLTMFEASMYLLSRASDVPLLFRRSAMNPAQTKCVDYILRNQREIFHDGKLAVLSGARGCGKTFAAYLTYAARQAAHVQMLVMEKQIAHNEFEERRADILAEGPPTGEPPLDVIGQMLYRMAQQRYDLAVRNPPYDQQRDQLELLQSTMYLMPSVYKAQDLASVSTRKNGRFEQAMGKNALVVIDDVGADHGTNWASAEWTMFYDNRYQCGLPTIITTNLLPSELCKRLGPRFADRYAEWAIGACISDEPSLRSQGC